jgi:hypothetical protein
MVEIAIGTVLRIPDGWDAFVYRGFLYVLVDGRFRVVEELPVE